MLTLLSTWWVTKKVSNLISSPKVRSTLRRSDSAQNKTKTQSWVLRRTETRKGNSVVSFCVRSNFWGMRRRHWRMWWPTALKKCLPCTNTCSSSSRKPSLTLPCPPSTEMGTTHPEVTRWELASTTFAEVILIKAISTATQKPPYACRYESCRTRGVTLPEQ